MKLVLRIVSPRSPIFLSFIESTSINIIGASGANAGRSMRDAMTRLVPTSTSLSHTLSKWNYRARNKGIPILLSMTQAGSDREDKQEQRKEISPNHLQTISSGSVVCTQWYNEAAVSRFCRIRSSCRIRASASAGFRSSCYHRSFCSNRSSYSTRSTC